MKTWRNELNITLLFWALFGAIFVLNNGLVTINLRPQATHVWRQTDCASYALNYYQNSQPFFEPQTHTLSGLNGHAVSEFPLIYYIAGKLYHIAGPKEGIIRAIDFFLFLLGCTCLLWLGFILLDNKLLALIPPLIAITSPYLFYYALNFLPDVPAFSLAMTGCFLMFLYFRTRRLRWVYLSAASFCVAMLLKVSAGISFFAIAAAVLLSREIRITISRKHKIHLCVLFAGASLIQLAWIEFARHYNEVNGTGQNLLGLYPMWDAPKEEMMLILKRFWHEWRLVIFHAVGWIWIAFIGCIIALKRKMLSRFIQAIVLFNLLGIVAYSVCWFRAYQDHDYYMINPFIAIIWMLLAACIIIDKAGIKARKVFVSLFVFVFIVSAIHSRHVQWGRYHNPHYISVNPDYFTVEPYLRSIGISRQDRVVSLPDLSPNITLYLMNQQGWTEFNDINNHQERTMQSGVKYLIISDTNYLHWDFCRKHLGDSVSKYKSIYIYKIK